MAFVFFSQLYLLFMPLNDLGYLLEEFNLLFKEKAHLKIIYNFFIVLIFLPYPCPTNTCLHISAQVVRLTTLPVDFSIKLPTKWYIANSNTARL